MKKRMIKMLSISLSLIMVFTCFNLIVFAEDDIQNKTIEEETDTTVQKENTLIQQDDNAIQPRLGDGTRKDDWQISLETNDMIVLENYLGTSPNVIIPGEIDGKQVYINGAISDESYDDYFNDYTDAFFDTSGRTEFGLSSQVISITFREVNRKKVKVENQRLTGLFYNGNPLYEDVVTSNYSSLTRIDTSGLDTSNVIDMAWLFTNCNNLTTLVGLDKWNTSSVTDMESMFRGCIKFDTSIGGGRNENLRGLSNWNVSSVEKMAGMFLGCSQLTNLTGLERWNTSSVTDMKSMFRGCVKLIDSATGASRNQNLRTLSNWNVSSVKKMAGMFYDCNSLSNLKGLEKWKVSSVTDMNYMFYNCSSLTVLTELEKWDVSSVIDMNHMFEGCSSLVSLIELKGWDVSSVENMWGMFTGCSSITTLTGLEKWDVTSVDRMWEMFLNCSSLSDITSLKHWDTASLEDICHMFDGCKQLTDLTPVSNWHTLDVWCIGGIYANCDKLRFADLSSWNPSGARNMTEIFKLPDGTAPLLVINSSDIFKNYNYAEDNRTPVGAIYETNGGKFSDNSTSKQGKTTYVLDNTTTAVEKFINNAVEVPTRAGYEFIGWENDLDADATVYERVTTTYTAIWKKKEENKLIDYPNEKVDKNKIDTSDPTKILTTIIVLIMAVLGIIKAVKPKGINFIHSKKV